MSHLLKKIIREEINSLVSNTKETAKKLRQEVVYLKELPFKSFTEKNGKEIWFFANNIVSYKIKFYVVKDSSEQWTAKLLVFWIKETRMPTSDAGKEIEKDFGPFESIDDLIIELNRKLENNLFLATDMYKDDCKENMNNEIILLLKRLKTLEKEIGEIKHGYFDELRMIHKDIKNLSDDKLREYSNEQAEEEVDKQFLILTLEKMNRLGYYADMAKMMHHEHPYKKN